MKKFEQMTSKKLNAIKEIATAAERAEIERILAARSQSQEDKKEAEVIPNKISLRMTDEERRALAEQLRRNIGHRCQVVPFNTAEWFSGYIAGIIEDKHTNKIMYAIKLDDGRRIVKVHNSNLLKIFEEVMTSVKIPRSYRTGEPKTEWTPEYIAEAMAKVAPNVGKLVTFTGFRSESMLTGRITGLVPEKRAQTILYRIEVPAPTKEQPDAIKVVHKVCMAPGLTIAEEFDEIGEGINAKFLERRERAVIRQTATPQDRVVKCEEALAKAKEKLSRVQEEVNARIEQLEDAKKDLAEFLAKEEAASLRNDDLF